MSARRKKISIIKTLCRKRKGEGMRERERENLDLSDKDA